VSENQKRNKPSDSLLNRLSAYQYTKWLSMNLVNEEKSSIKKYVFFISHSTKDTGLYVQDLCEIFETLRVQNFFADRDAPLGSFLPDQVKNAIDNSELFLVICAW
jgi:IS30 family transposase